MPGKGNRMGAAVLLLALLAAASPAGAGMVIRYQGGGGTAPRAVYIQDNKLRQDLGRMIFILDVGKGWVYYLNPGRKVYWAGPVKRLARASREATRRHLEKMLQRLPPQRRQALRRALETPQSPPAPVRLEIEVRSTSEMARIAGYLCRRYDVLNRGRPLMSLWMAPALKVAEEIDPVRMGAMMAQMGRMESKGSPLTSPQVQALWRKGYPLKQVNYAPGGTTTVVARQVETKPLPPELFQVPQGWRAVGFLEVMR